jgi:hypothetical protein
MPKFGNAEIRLQIPYPLLPRQRCDLMVGSDQAGWAIEVKMARFRGDNGKPADETISHILSPYESDRSALTDCEKLAKGGFPRRTAILIYGFDFSDRPLDAIIEAFETLARARCILGRQAVAEFVGLIHPVHQCGRVFGWPIG